MVAPEDRIGVPRDRGKADVRGRFYAWCSAHPAESALLDELAPDVVLRLWSDAWQAGAWDAIRRNATLGLNLAQIIERLEELATMYSDADAKQRIDRELEASSAYWHSEVTP